MEVDRVAQLVRAYGGESVLETLRMDKKRFPNTELIAQEVAHLMNSSYQPKLVEELYVDDSKLREHSPMEIAKLLDAMAQRNYRGVYIYPFARRRLAYYAGIDHVHLWGTSDRPYTPTMLRSVAEAIRANLPALIADKLTGQGL